MSPTRASSQRESRPPSGEHSGPRSDGAPADRRAVREARRFARDARRLLKKHRKRLQPPGIERVERSINELETLLGQPNIRAVALASAVKDLDGSVDAVLGFARKSTAREFFESIAVAVLIAVLLRAFVIEAFKIPSGSMIPTLEVGDHIFVNKFIYGLRVPLTNQWFVEWSGPKRGDVIVFRYPRDISKDYIKRTVAVAGDHVRVEGRDVYVNGKKLERERPKDYNYVEDSEPGSSESYPPALLHANAYAEQSVSDPSKHYTVLYAADRSSRASFPGDSGDLPGLGCSQGDGTTPPECVVLDGYVFVMGDNRDNSSDSRAWGGVPRSHIKGKAMFVWWSRGANSGVRWNRIGTPIQ